MSNKKLFTNTILYTIGEVMPRALNFLLLPIYTRCLSPADYGVISYTSTIIAFLYTLGAFGLNSYVLRYFFIHEKEDEKRRVLGTAQAVIIILNVCIILLAFSTMPYLIAHFGIQIPWEPYFKLAFIINFFDCLSIVPLVIYRVRQDAIKFVALGFSRTLLVAGLTVYFLAIEKRGLIGFYQASLYVVVPYAIIYLLIMRKYAIWSLDLNYIKEGFKFAAPLIPGSICYLLLSSSDRIILERNVGIEELGIYNVACQMALVLNIIINSGYKAIEPEMFRRYGQEDFYTFIKRYQKVFFLFVYVGGLIICFFSQEVFYVMTSEAYHKGYMLVPALMIGVIMTGQNVIYGGLLQCERRTKIIGLSTVIGAVVSIAINLTLTPFWGTYAAACASAISFMVMNVILFIAMAFPEKSMSRETILVFLIPAMSYAIFYYFSDISVISVMLKIFLVVLYSNLAIRLLKIDKKYAKLLLTESIYKTGRKLSNNQN